MAPVKVKPEKKGKKLIIMHNDVVIYEGEMDSEFDYKKNKKEIDAILEKKLKQL